MSKAIRRAVDAAVSAATFDPNAPEEDGRDARVRFEQESLGKVTALYRDPGTRDAVLAALDAAIQEGMSRAVEQGAHIETEGFRASFVALRIKDRLAQVLDRTYGERPDGTTGIVREREMGPEEIY